ncbi:hypothetical protein ACGVWS_09810 [Enterobacteriaceae bacterium LUAb1]
MSDLNGRGRRAGLNCRLSSDFREACQEGGAWVCNGKNDIKTLAKRHKPSSVVKNILMKKQGQQEASKTVSVNIREVQCWRYWRNFYRDNRSVTGLC